MDKTIKATMNELAKLNVSIERILADTRFEMYDDLSGLNIDYTRAEELFLVDELGGILDKLADVSHNLKYLEMPIKEEGTLHKNKNGRYQLNNIELSSGHHLEYLATDDRYMRENEDGEYVVCPYWSYGRIEHDGTDYYIVGARKGTQLEGLKARIR